MKALTNPIHTQKKFHAERWREKKYHASTYLKKKNSWGIKGLKKDFMPIPNHPTSSPPSEVKWLAPKNS